MQLCFIAFVAFFAPRAFGDKKQEAKQAKKAVKQKLRISPEAAALLACFACNEGEASVAKMPASLPEACIYRLRLAFLGVT
jgi:hypothetical protein